MAWIVLDPEGRRRLVAVLQLADRALARFDVLALAQVAGLVHRPALAEGVEVAASTTVPGFGMSWLGGMVTLPASTISLLAYRPSETLRLVGWTIVTTKLALSTNLYLSAADDPDVLPGV